MGNKADVQEVVALSEKVSNAKESLITDFEIVEEKITSLNNMNNFSGKSAEKAKYYFDEFHRSIVKGFKQLAIELDESMIDTLNDFAEGVDQSEQALLLESYLEATIEKVDDNYNDFMSLAKKVDGQITKVDELVSTKKPTRSELGLRRRKSVNTIKDLTESIGSFSQQQKTTDLQDMLASIKKLMDNAKTEKGEKRFVEFYRGESKNAKAHLDKWVKKNQDNSAGDIATTTSKWMNYAFASNKLLNGGTNAAAMMYIHSTMEKGDWKRLQSKGLHALDTKSYVKYNNVLHFRDIHRVSNKEMVNIIKQGAKNWKNPSKALKNILPFSYKPNGSMGGAEFANKIARNWFNDTLELDRYKGFKGTKPADQARRMGKVFYDETIGTKLKTTNRLITITDWKNPKSLMTNSVKEVKDNFKGLNVLGKAAKIAGPLGAGIHITDNFIEHKNNPQKAIIGSAVDIAGSSAAAATGAAVGSAFLPPLGTVVGAGVGIAGSALLNKKYGKPPKSTLDRTKSSVNKAVNKIAGWFK